ncbi:hypothetical protein DdX_08183 [Ditylenchus destructor]|uniref:DUF4817 domain-containing protein n=1 Tax=Ditylenchus destructor TaxID=166010 RepID=A0AAD4R7J3_9BILA|nr:hypothetical protein DdX_08183 [Ditylenchus destructor]
MVWTLEQKAWCILEFHTHRSAVVVQRNFRRNFNIHRNKSVPAAPSITGWYENFNHGQFDRKKRTNTKWIRTELTIETVLQRLREEGEGLSIRQLAREGVLSTTINADSNDALMLTEEA